MRLHLFLQGINTDQAFFYRISCLLLLSVLLCVFDERDDFLPDCLEQSWSYGIWSRVRIGWKERGSYSKWTVKNKQRAFPRLQHPHVRFSIRHNSSRASKPCCHCENVGRRISVIYQNEHFSSCKCQIKLQIILWQHCAWQQCPARLCASLTLWVCVCFQDEGALVRAARNLGFVFSGRTPDSVIMEMVSMTRHGL